MPAHVTKDMIIAEVLDKYPSSGAILLDRGMACVGCSVARMGTLEEGAKSHDVDIDELLEVLNAHVAENSTEETDTP